MARTSCKTLLKYKQRSPKPGFISLAVTEIGLGTQAFETQKILESMRSILPARRESNNQLDGVTTVALKMADLLG